MDIISYFSLKITTIAMKKLTFIAAGIAVMLFSSFSPPKNDIIISPEAMIGKWHYTGLIFNGTIERIDRCDQKDYLILNAEGTFESLQHSSLLTNDEKTIQITCNPLLKKGKWSLDQANLVRESNYTDTARILELTYNTLRIQHSITYTDQHLKKCSNTYIETYQKR